MSLFDVGDIVSALHGARDEWRDSQKRTREPDGREFPSREAMATTSEWGDLRMAGITFCTPILAVDRMPQRTLRDSLMVTPPQYGAGR